MATRKKQQVLNRIGLLYAPSRKQVSEANVSDLKESIRSPNVKYYSTSIQNNNSANIYSPSAGTNGRIVYWCISVESGLLATLTLNPSIQEIFTYNGISIPTTAFFTQQFPYETAPYIPFGSTLKLSTTGTGMATVIFHIIEEQI